MRLKNVFLLWLLIACHVCGFGQQATPTRTASGQVMLVLDGDTMEVLCDSVQVRVRLHGIDCPEKNQPHGNQAKQFTQQWASGQRVTLQILDVDRYGRLVARVILPSGLVLNEQLVMHGHAWMYQKYTDDPTLQVLEHNAKAGRLGLWALPNPIAPWDWRKGVH